MILRGTTVVTAVLGCPIEHSRSPAVIGAAFAAVGLDGVMVPLRVALADAAAVVPALAAAGVRGASVTSPLKQAVIATCVELTPRARRAGAVNCLDFADGRIVGDSTDGAGLLACLAAHGWDVVGRQVVVLGAGGAARSVETSLADAGARTVVIARRPAAADWLDARQVQPWTTAALAAALASADLLVDATAMALDPVTEPAALATLPLDALSAHAGVISLVYHRVPGLLTAARARGLRVLDGGGMLVHQAALAFTRWTGRAAPLDEMSAALRAP